jgi:hypothetical protein
VEGVDFALEFFRGVGFGVKRPRDAGESFRTTILVGLVDFSGRPFCAGGEIVAEEEVDMMVDGWSCGLVMAGE